MDAWKLTIVGRVAAPRAGTRLGDVANEFVASAVGDLAFATWGSFRIIGHGVVYARMGLIDADASSSR